MPVQLKIDFVSDVSCPWCAIGLYALKQAISNLSGEISVDLHFQPFELNPKMATEGQSISEHLAQKYGMSAEQLAQSSELIRARGAEVGFTFNMDKRSRIYNTFDAHRLLHWAEEEGRQQVLKEKLLQAYFRDGENPSDHATLVRIAGDAGLDRTRAAAILASDEYTDAVRERAQFYLRSGIRAVPAIIINEQHLIEGGQPTAVFEQALRQISAAI